MQKKDWYVILLGIVVFILIGLNETGYGAIAFPPLIFLAVWIMFKIFPEEKPGE